MTDRDRVDLTALATGGLSFWKARSLRGRITREPELAQEWAAIQSLYGQLRTMANVHPVPATPAWAPSQAKRRIMVGRLLPAIVAIGIGTLAVGWVMQNLLVMETKKSEDSSADSTQYIPLLYDAKVAPGPIFYDPRLKARALERVGMVGDMYTKTNMAWKVFGTVQVKVTYFDGMSRTLTSKYPSDKATMKRLTELGVFTFYRGDIIPLVRWSRGERVNGELLRYQPLESLPTGVNPKKESWAKRVAAGRMTGYGKHEIKDDKGKVLATLVVEPLPVQLRHDSTASHRRAEK